jgi:hypothetical protein
MLSDEEMTMKSEYSRLGSPPARWVPGYRPPLEPRIQFGTAPSKPHVSAESQMGNGIGNTLENMSAHPTLRQTPPTSEFDAVDDFVLRPAFGLRINRIPRVLIVLLQTTDLSRGQEAQRDSSFKQNVSQPATWKNSRRRMERNRCPVPF